MNKKNKIIILICTIFVILTIISIYYFLTRKTYSLEVYQYTYNIADLNPNYKPKEDKEDK